MYYTRPAGTRHAPDVSMRGTLASPPMFTLRPASFIIPLAHSLLRSREIQTDRTEWQQRKIRYTKQVFVFFYTRLVKQYSTRTVFAPPPSPFPDRGLLFWAEGERTRGSRVAADSSSLWRILLQPCHYCDPILRTVRIRRECCANERYFSPREVAACRSACSAR